MIELGQPKGALPLQTGDYIPKGRFALGLSNLIPLTEERKVTLMPRTLTEIQGRLGSETNAVLPDVLIESLGLTNLTFVELYHPDSMPLVFAGHENEGFVNRSLDKSVAIISLDRSTGMGWSGAAGVRFNNRLLPVSIGVSGVDQQTKRIVSVSYGAEYDLPEAESSSERVGRVTFILDEVGISVSREDGFEFKERRGELDILPYTYVSQYYDGIFTKEMLAEIEINGRQVFSNRINVGRYLRFGNPRLESSLGLRAPIFVGLENYPKDFEVDHSDKLVKIGTNIWEIKVPEILPTAGKCPKFLQISK